MKYCLDLVGAYGFTKTTWIYIYIWVVRKLFTKRGIIMFIVCMCLYSSTVGAQEAERLHSLKGTGCMIDLCSMQFGIWPKAVP